MPPRPIAPSLLARLDLNHLRTFVAVARAGSFSGAQRELRVRQPAISKAIGALEGALGLELFERGPRGVRTTSGGARVLEACERAFGELTAMSEAVARREAALSGDLVVCAQEHVAIHLLPAALAELRKRHPAVFPRVVTGASHLLLRELVEGRAELGLFFYLEPSSLVDRMVLAKMPSRLVVAPGTQHDEGVLTSFIGSREVDDLANKSYPTVAELQRKRPSTRITLSCSSLEAHKSFVKAGLGISILPEVVVADELARGELVHFRPDWSFHASLELVTRRAHRLSRAGHALVRALKEHVATVGDGRPRGQLGDRRSSRK